VRTTFDPEETRKTETKARTNGAFPPRGPVLSRRLQTEGQAARQQATASPLGKVSLPVGGSSTNRTGKVFVPQTTESYSHDQDGNLTNLTGDGCWTYKWDGENRLSARQATLVMSEICRIPEEVIEIDEANSIHINPGIPSADECHRDPPAATFYAALSQPAIK
jgi:hypothetical protein